MNGASSANIPYKNELRDRQGCGEYGRRHKPLLDAAINDIRIRFEGKTVEVEFNDTAPKPLQGFTVTAPVQILEHNTGCWWERTITARIRDGSTIPRRVGSRVLELDHRHTHAHSSRRHSTHPGHRRQASSKRGKQLSVNQPLTDSEARNIFINGAEDFYSLSANPQFSNVAELFDAWLTEHDRQLLAKTETEAGKRISSELKLEHASDAHARTEPSRAYIQGCKAARSLLEDAIRDMTQEQGTL